MTDECLSPAPGEEWVWVDAVFKLAGAAFIIAGNYAYFQFRAQAQATSPSMPRSEWET